MDPVAVPLVHGAADLTVDWCNAALGGSLGGARVVDVALEPIGTGQVADTVRLHVSYDGPGAGPATLVAKVPAADETSRAGARSTRTYEIEASFYREVAAGLPVRTPFCHHASHDPATDAYVVLLEDVAPARQGDQMAGCPVGDIEAAIDELALLHGRRWGDESLTRIGWLHRSAPEAMDNVIALLRWAAGPFKERYTDRLDGDTVAVMDRLVPLLDQYIPFRPRPWTVVHGDFRADNLLFGGDRVVVVDWQTVTVGPGPFDLSYLLGGSLVPDARRRHESALVDRYVERLGEQGVEVDRAVIWELYRRYALAGLVMAVVASALVEQTDRGDDMFVVMAERSAHHALDLDTEALFAAERTN